LNENNQKIRLLSSIFSVRLVLLTKLKTQIRDSRSYILGYYLSFLTPGFPLHACVQSHVLTHSVTAPHLIYKDHRLHEWKGMEKIKIINVKIKNNVAIRIRGVFNQNQYPPPPTECIVPMRWQCNA